MKFLHALAVVFLVAGVLTMIGAVPSFAVAEIEKVVRSQMLLSGLLLTVALTAESVAHILEQRLPDL